MSNNKYMVSWHLVANTDQATANVRGYSAAVRAATKNQLAFNKAVAAGRTPQSVSGVSTGAQNISKTQMPPAIVGSSSQPSKGAVGTKKSVSPSRSGAPTKRGSTAGSGNRMYQSPLKGTPFYGLMGTLLAYSAVKSQVSEAAEYAHVMETAKAILNVADDDLGTFESRFERLSKSVRQIGLETKFTATEVAGATKYLAMAGMSMDTIQSSMRHVTNLAIIGDEDLALIADLSTNIMTGYGISGGSMGAVSDVLTSTMTRSNVSITELAESYKMSAGYLRSAGIDFEESAAAIGILGDAGIKATMAGTALRAMSIRFIKPTKEATEVLDNLGVTFTKTVNDMGREVVKVKPLYEIFTELYEKGATLKDLQTIFGRIGGNAALALMANTDKLGTLTQQNLYSYGVSERTSKKKQETTMGRADQLKSMLSEQVISVYLEMEGIIQQFLVNLTESLSSEGFKDGIKSMGSAIFTFVDLAGKAVTMLTRHFDTIKTYMVGKFIHNQILNITSGMMGLGNSINRVGKESEKSSFSIGSLISPISLIASVVGSAAFTLYEFHNNQQLAFQNLEEKYPTVYSNFTDIGLAVKKAADEMERFNKGITDKNIEEITGISSPTWMQKLSIWLKYMLVGVPGSDQYKHDPLNTGTFKITSPEAEFASAPTRQAMGLAKVDAYSAREKLWGDLKKAKDPQDMERIINENLALQSQLKPIDKSMYGMWGVYLKPGVGDKDPYAFRSTREYQSEFMNIVTGDADMLKEAVGAIGNKDKALSLLSQMGIGVLSNMGVNFNASTGQFDFPVQPGKEATDDERQDYVDNINKMRESPFVKTITEALPMPIVTSLLETLGIPSTIVSSKPMYTVGGNIINADDMGADDVNNVNGTGGSSMLSRSTTQPKQVIINIDNLMSVNDVKINDDNRSSTLSTLKEDVTALLLDIVHDTSASFHGTNMS